MNNNMHNSLHTNMQNNRTKSKNRTIKKSRFQLTKTKKLHPILKVKRYYNNYKILKVNLTILLFTNNQNKILRSNNVKK